jgi:hypothetical protein
VDNSDAYRWGPPLALTITGWLASAVAACWCLFGTEDAPGRLFAGVTALVFAAAALFGTRANPRLAASGAGIEVRGLSGARRYDWGQIAGVRLVHTRRLGRDVPTLEIDACDGAGVDAEERLLVFGRMDLGADPRDVADTLDVLRADSA